jgi:hypothetical protein
MTAASAAAVPPAAPPQGPRPRLSELVDTFTAFFLYWDLEQTRFMLAAVSRYIEARGPRVQHEWELPEQHIPIGALADAPDDHATDTWVDAMRRFALPSPALAAAPGYRDWVRALWLGAVAMSLAAQEVMFTDAPAVLRLRRSRMPRITTLRRFMPVLQRELAAFRARGFAEPALFVRQCRAFYCYGVEDASFLPDFD